MTINRIQDKYNSNKTWLVKRSKCGHYYVNQEICGRKFYTAYSRSTRRFLTAVGII